MTTYFDELTVGEKRRLGSVTAKRDEMLEFARRYDPQPFHVDPEVAADMHFDGIIASGWYTASLCMRLLVEEVLLEAAALGALGLDELRWLEPVRPGDELLVSNEVVSKRPSKSDPQRGVVTARLEATQQDETEVLSWTAKVLWARNTENEA